MLLYCFRLKTSKQLEYAFLMLIHYNTYWHQRKRQYQTHSQHHEYFYLFHNINQIKLIKNLSLNQSLEFQDTSLKSLGVHIQLGCFSNIINCDFYHTHRIKKQRKIVQLRDLHLISIIIYFIIVLKRKRKANFFIEYLMLIFCIF